MQVSNLLLSSITNNHKHGSSLRLYTILNDCTNTIIYLLLGHFQMHTNRKSLIDLSGHFEREGRGLQRMREERSYPAIERARRVFQNRYLQGESPPVCVYMQ